MSVMTDLLFGNLMGLLSVFTVGFIICMGIFFIWLFAFKS